MSNEPSNDDIERASEREADELADSPEFLEWYKQRPKNKKIFFERGSDGTIRISTKPKSPKLEAAPHEQQLALFETWFSTEKNRTLPHADTIGRYVLARRKNLWGTKEALTRTFPVKNGGTAKISAALLTDSNKVLLPGALEQLIELVLRKMTLEQQAEMGLFREKTTAGFHHISVAFTLYDLRRRLAEDGHERASRDIKEALNVMDRCNWSVEAPIDREFVGELRGPILRIEAVKKTKQRKGGMDKEMYICLWHPLIAEEILSNRGLLIDAGITKIKDPLARWAAHRLNARYRQAAKDDWINERGYTVTFATILEESGIEPESRMRDTLERIRKAWAELQDTGFLHSMRPYSECLDMEATSRRPRVVGATWHLHPSAEWAQTVIEGNREKKLAT